MKVKMILFLHFSLYLTVSKFQVLTSYLMLFYPTIIIPHLSDSVKNYSEKDDKSSGRMVS